MSGERALYELLEARLRELNVAAAGRLSWYHTHDSRHSAAGFPDYAIAGQGPWFAIFAELKADTRTAELSRAQRWWLSVLAGTGTPAYVVVGEAGIASLVDLVIHALNGRLLAQPAVVYRLGPKVRGAEDVPELAVPIPHGLSAPAGGQGRASSPAD